MKIEDLLLLYQSPTTRPTRVSPGEENFSEYLHKAVSSAHRGQSGDAAAGLNPVSAAESAHEAAYTLAELADGALCRLEIFQSSLARGETTLKKMVPLVQKLEDDSRQLRDAAQNLPEGSPLRQILEETAALAYVESFKFNRGDYIQT